MGIVSGSVRTTPLAPIPGRTASSRKIAGSDKRSIYIYHTTGSTKAVISAGKGPGF